MTKVPLRGLLLLAVILAAGGLVGFYIANHDDRDHDDDQDRPIVAPDRTATEDGRLVVILDADAQREAGIQTLIPAASQSRRQVASFGTVVDPSDIIETSAQIGEARARVSAADAKLAASAAAHARAKLLFSDGKSMSAAQMQTAEEAFRADEAARQESVSRMQAVLEAARQSWGDELAKAFADASPQARALRDGKSVLVRIAVPGIDQPPHAVEVVWEGGPPVSATLVSVLPKVDPHFQQRLALYTAPRGAGLTPGATVTARLPSGVARDGVTVPTSAVVWADGGAWVFREISEGHFTREAVTDSETRPDGTLFVAGLASGQPVVVKGAQVLLSEESRGSIQVGEEGRSK